MVRGMESFREWFRGYEESYALAGEAACDLLRRERGEDAGTVKEIDFIIFDQDENSPFWRRFADYVREAGYEKSGPGGVASVDHAAGLGESAAEPGERKTAAASAVYAKPISSEYPKFMRVWAAESFDGAYAALIRQERTTAFGVSVLTVPALIALEAKAWMGLTGRKEAGKEIRSGEIERHKNTAFSLTALLPAKPEKPLFMPGSIRSDMTEFLKRMETENLSPRRLGLIGTSKEEVLEELREVFADGDQ